VSGWKKSVGLKQTADSPIPISVPTTKQNGKINKKKPSALELQGVRNLEAIYC
jgi:hypothetical protein